MTTTNEKKVNFETDPDDTIVTLNDLMEHFQLQRISIWKRIKQGYLPPAFDKIGRRKIWTLGQLRGWQATRQKVLATINKKNEEEMVKNITEMMLYKKGEQK